MASTHRKRTAQFKLYFTDAEKADLLRLAREWRCFPSDVLRELLKKEAHGETKTEETSRSSAAAGSGSGAIDRWREARRLRRERERLRSGG